MHLTWRSFSGEIPRLEPHLLPDQAAILARNTRLEQGSLNPLRLPGFVMALGKPGVKKTIYRYGQTVDSDTNFWFHWPEDVDVTRGPLEDDTQERVFFTGAGAPMTTDSTMATSGVILPSASYRIGLPAPTSPPTVLVNGAGTGDPVKLVVAYQYVNQWNEPGPISLASPSIDYYPGQSLAVSGMGGLPSGQYFVRAKRIYVAQTDSTGSTALRFWTEILAGQDSASGPVFANLLGETVESPSMIAPPDDLFGILYHPNRFLVGFTKRRICRSEANKPYGWPAAYRDPVGDDIVGGAIIGQSTVICTKGKTYMAIGQDPLNMAIVDLAGYQPCASKRSIKALPFGVVYAGPDGLVLVPMAGALSVVSEPFFTRDQWQEFNPSSMHAVVHDRRYYCWYDNAGVRGGLIFEFGPDGAITSFTRTDIYATAAYADHRRDDLFVALPSDNNLYKWGSGIRSNQVWASKEIRLARPQAVGAAAIIADVYPVAFRLYGDGTIVDSYSAPSSAPFTLRATDRYAKVRWEVEGSSAITQVDLASSIFDLRHQ